MPCNICLSERSSARGPLGERLPRASIGLVMLAPFFVFLVVLDVWNGRAFFAQGDEKRE